MSQDIGEVIEIASVMEDLCVDNKKIYEEYTVPTYEYANLRYQTFFDNHLIKNQPCVIQNISNGWQCSSLWVKNNKISFDYLINQYGDLEAPVADCNSINFNSQCKTDYKVKDYMQYLSNIKCNEILYLKDWHLRRTRPDDMFYEVPHLFASDWLNEYSLDINEDDFMFVYIGPKDSWTPLHVDVYNSYSWSVNVYGRKKWILFQPGEETKLKDSLGNLPLLFDPKVHKNVKKYEIIQDQGDAIFVPSGWHHQVSNLLDTISINHNWINGSNIKKMWEALKECLKCIEKEIEEFKNTPEFTTQCQTILKSLFGINHESFINFVSHIAKKRILQLDRNDKNIHFQKYKFGMKHILFDLEAINNLLTTILEDDNIFFQSDLKRNLVELQCFVLNSLTKFNSTHAL